MGRGSSVRDVAPLDVMMADDLSSLAFAAEGRNLGVIAAPRLLWECSCEPSRGGRSPQRGPCVIHALEQGERISSQFGDRTRIWFRGLSVCWDDARGWPPAIDSFLQTRALLNAGWPGPAAERLWDIGAGTGFLGLQLAHASPSIRQLRSIEASPQAAEMCDENLRAYVHRPELEKVTTCCPAQSLSVDLFRPGDAIVAAPPYLPRPAWLADAPEGGPAQGTGLLRHLIRFSAAAGLPVALGYSLLAQPEVDAVQASLPSLVARIVGERRVPLRLPLPRDYLDWLLADRGLEEDARDVFAYHHWVRVAIFERP
jgi:hypothetical protein